jgi:dGTPase
MDWKSLLSTERFGQPIKGERTGEEIRTEFQRDYDRIIFSSPFRRLQNKTQVFPLPGSVFVHNRLTHSLEVASVGRSLGNLVFDRISSSLNNNEKHLVREIGTVVATACLAHDLGNPPFGHSGEKAISHYFRDGKGKDIQENVSELEYNDLVGFEGNANLIRLLTNKFTGRREGGYALTFASLGTMIKYPFDSSLFYKKKKYGYFQTEKETFELIMEKLGIPVVDKESGIFARHPLVYLMEAADDICYQVMDLEDAHKLKIISRERVHELFMDFLAEDKDSFLRDKIKTTFNEVTDPNEQVAYLRALVISKLVNSAASSFVMNYDQIMDGNYMGKLLDEIDPVLKQAMDNCSQVAVNEVYRHPSVVKIEISGYNVLGFLLDEFYHAVMHPESDYAKKMMSLFPLQFRSQDGNDYKKARSVVDFIAGMTDVYAVDLYKQIRGLEL